MNNVPKIIWQTHNYILEDLPENFKKTAATWKTLNPDWEYRYVDHIQREEIIKQNPIFWKYYHTQNPPCQADMWRYLITYKYGGVYADMDSICTIPIDSVLNNINDCKNWELAVPSPIKKYHYSKSSFIDFNKQGLNGYFMYPLENLLPIYIFSTNNANFAIKKESNIMKNIIEKSEQHLIETISSRFPYTNLLPPFLDVVQGLKYKHLQFLISYQFNGLIHEKYVLND